MAERYAYGETRIFRKVGRYRETVEHRFAWRVVGREDLDTVLETAYYHRPLSWYFRALRAAGLAVTAFEEPGHQGWSEASSDRGLASMSDERTPVSEVLARVSEEITSAGRRRRHTSGPRTSENTYTRNSQNTSF